MAPLAGHFPGPVAPRVPVILPPVPPPPPVRAVEDTATFSNELARQNRRDTAPTYADYLEERNRKLRQFRTDLARDLPLFSAPEPQGAQILPQCRPAYSGARIGDVVAKIGPAPAPAKTLVVTDLSVMGDLIDTLV